MGHGADAGAVAGAGESMRQRPIPERVVERTGTAVEIVEDLDHSGKAGSWGHVAAPSHESGSRTSVCIHADAKLDFRALSTQTVRASPFNELIQETSDAQPFGPARRPRRRQDAARARPLNSGGSI
jgi:hypothetical protein